MANIFCSDTFRGDMYFSNAKIRVYLLCYMKDYRVLITFRQKTWFFDSLLSLLSTHKVAITKTYFQNYNISMKTLKLNIKLSIALECFRIVTHTYPALFSIKMHFYETNNHKLFLREHQKKQKKKAMLRSTFLLILLTSGIIAKQGLLHESDFVQHFQN